MQRTFAPWLASGGAGGTSRLRIPAIRIQKAVSRDCASICLLAIQLSASRAELTASTAPPFGYKKTPAKPEFLFYFSSKILASSTTLLGTWSNSVETETRS